MKKAYSFEEIRAAERRAIESGETVLSLMERAGKALADAVEGTMSEREVHDVLFVCGGGNNGGDGFAAARILLERGYDVAVLCLAKTFSEACLAQKERFTGEIFGKIPKRHFFLAVDCLFGTGLSRPLEGETLALLDFLESCGEVISCDLPSGLAENGVAAGRAVRASRTVTMGGLKRALLMADGVDLAGEIKVAPIGLCAEGGIDILEPCDVARYFPKRLSHTNKGDYGTAAILAGRGPLGASVLSARACLKSGAGYTKLFLPPEFYPSGETMLAAISAMPACILKRAGETEELFRADAVAFGSGAGVSEETYRTIKKFLLSYRGKLVLDADALSSLAAYGMGVLHDKRCRVAITPHPAEFARLTGKTVGEVLSDFVSLAQEFAQNYGVTVILKNNRTVITDGTRTVLNPTGSPALAKGGSGDVLSGVLAGTLARGLTPFEGGVASCYVLGKAGELAAEALGEVSADALDVIKFLPHAIKLLQTAKA